MTDIEISRKSKKKKIVDVAKSIGIKKEDISNFKNYIRILGFNKKGKDYLNRIKKEISLPIITNYSNSKGLLYLDNKVYSILSIILPLQEQKKYIDKD